jgi:hypothetical protein
VTSGPQKYADPTFKAAITDTIIDRLAEGESIVSICRDKQLPHLSTVMAWQADDAVFAGRITRAREAGYLIRGEKAVDDAKQASDPALGRLAFDAERWYLGKLSNAFSDNKTKAVEISGPNGGAIPMADFTSMTLQEKADAMKTALSE